MGNKIKSDKSGQIERLRKSAEEHLRKSKVKDVESEVYGDMQKLIHKLQVHQIELEMQNEELHRTQLESEESQEKYIELYDFAPVGYLTLNEKGMISELNLAAAGFLGIEKNSLINKLFSYFIKSEFRDMFYLYRQKVLESSTKKICELVLKKNDGAFFHARLDSISAEIKGKQVMHIVLTDITDRKLAEEALQTSERHLRAILEASPESAFLMGIDGRFLMGNKMTALRVKTDIETLINLNLYDFLPPDVAESRKKKVQQAIETGEPVQFEDERFGRIILNSIYPIYGKDNQVNRLAVFGLDITERKRAEEERERLIVELREALSKVKLLSGFIPICASCKKIRNDKGYWEQMELYIRDHSEAEFSHSICPECAEKLYPEYYKKE
jgi:PAS domain S-box-containing protein